MKIYLQIYTEAYRYMRKTYICAHIYTCIHKKVRRYIHTHTNTYLHTYTNNIYKK